MSKLVVISMTIRQFMQLHCVCGMFKTHSLIMLLVVMVRVWSHTHSPTIVIE